MSTSNSSLEERHLVILEACWHCFSGDSAVISISFDEVLGRSQPYHPLCNLADIGVLVALGYLRLVDKDLDFVQLTAKSVQLFSASD